MTPAAFRSIRVKLGLSQADKLDVRFCSFTDGAA